MQHVTPNRFITGLFALLLLCVTLPALAQPDPAQQSNSRSLPELTETASLDDLNNQLDLIRQKVSVSANDDLLSSLRQAALQVQKQADSLTSQQTTDIEHLDEQINILGPVERDEAPTISSQRKALTAQKNRLISDQKQTSGLSQSARDLATQIFSLRRSLFDSQISTRSASPLSTEFWSSIIRPTDDDLGRLQGLLKDVKNVFTTAMAPGNRLQFIAVVLGALLIWVVGRRLLESLLIRLIPQRMPWALWGLSPSGGPNMARHCRQ